MTPARPYRKIEDGPAFFCSSSLNFPLIKTG